VKVLTVSCNVYDIRNSSNLLDLQLEALYICLIYNYATNFLTALLEWEKKNMIIPVLLWLNIHILISSK
jgi:hypothetical protein